jgi:hypothetical protein
VQGLAGACHRRGQLRRASGNVPYAVRAKSYGFWCKFDAVPTSVGLFPFD